MIGTEWLEHEGPTTVKCKIIGKLKSSAGTEYYAVQKTHRDGTIDRSQDLIKAEEAEKEVKLRMHRYAANEKFRIKEDAQNKAAQAKHDDEQSLDGFAPTLPVMKRGLAQKVLLTKGIRVNGKTFNKLRDAVRDLVKQGYVVDDKDHLINPKTEGWLKLGAIAVAYADFLIKNGKYK